MRKILIYMLIAIITVMVVLFITTYSTYSEQMKLANERIQNESQIMKTEYGNLEYAVRGEGKPILLVHGAGGGFDQGLWLGEICLENGYKFIAPSKFGYLKSDTPDNKSIKVQAEQYALLLDSLNVDKVVVIGVSSGGPSSMQFANDYPERVEKLILLSAVSMPPNPNDKDPFFIKLIHLIQKSDYAYWIFTKAFETQILGLMGIPSDDYKQFSPGQKILAQEMLDVMHPMSQRYSGTVIDGLMIKDFEIPTNITTPTLIIHSKNDGLVSYSHAEFANKKINNSKIILYENGGHGALSELEDARRQISSFLENPEEVIRNLLTSEELAANPKITVVKSSSNHIRADLFFNPSGYYILAAKINGEWIKVLQGNGIPACSEIDKYNFPADIVPACMNENGVLVKNNWELIKNAIINCEVNEVMQTHSRYVTANLKDGEQLEGIEPTIDDIIDLAVESQSSCGKIMMATE